MHIIYSRVYAHAQIKFQGCMYIATTIPMCAKFVSISICMGGMLYIALQNALQNRIVSRTEISNLDYHVLQVFLHLESLSVCTERALLPEGNKNHVFIILFFYFFLFAIV